MRTTQYMLATLKEIPSNTEVISHQLMLRAGMIRKLASGLYTWLPTGTRVLRKVEKVIREEMNNIGAIEICMPIFQPSELWEKSGRAQEYGSELLTLKDRNLRSFILGPTHEEVVTHFLRNELKSYKQLPLNLYQIQTKFRDELRPRFGVMRSREFIMKDAYSFHISNESLQQTYNKMYHAYIKAFQRMGLDFRVVQAETGYIGGNISHEFQVLAHSGENEIFLSDKSKYAAKCEKIEALAPFEARSVPTQDMVLFDTPYVKTINDLVTLHHIPIEKTLKTLFVKANQKSGYSIIALLIRGDHNLNLFKLEKVEIIASPLEMASEEQIRLLIGAGPGSLGPVGLHSIPIIADRTAANTSDFCTGANIDGKHIRGINWGRDLPEPRIEDIRNVVVGDPSPDGQGNLIVKRSIEVGHIFQLGTKYSKIMNAQVKSETGENKSIVMGCYGIGITRAVAAIIEQNHDVNGIIWPTVTIAPFTVAIVAINLYKTIRVKKVAEELYENLLDKGIDVILDDRKDSPGVMFADIELLGIPHMIIVSDRNLDKGNIEYKNRSSGKYQTIKQYAVVDFLITTLNSNTI